MYFAVAVNCDGWFWWQLVVRREAFAYEMITLLIRGNTILRYLEVEVFFWLGSL